METRFLDMPDPDNLISFEQALEQVGDHGRYQKTLFWCFLIPLSFIIPWTALTPIFQVSLPDHWCYVPGKPENLSIEEWKLLTIPWEFKEDYRMSQCTQYVTPLEEAPDSYKQVENSTGCQNGWQFNTTLYDATLATDRAWVCDKRSYGPRWLSVGVAGNVVGTLLLSFLADKYGRKPILLIITQLYGIANISKLFVTEEWATLLMMFISSTTFPANLQICMIIVMEQVSNDMRAAIATFSFQLWTLGMCLLPMIAWLSRDWITLGFMTSSPFFLFVLCSCMYESPGWLVSVGNPHKAARILRKIAKINKKIPPEDLETRLQVPLNNEDSKMKELGFLELFSMPTLRTRAIILTTAYACNNLVYYGLLYNTSNMSGNEFLNFFFLSVSELPGNLIGWVCAQKIGRRLTASGFFFLTALFISFAIFLPASFGITTTVCLVTSKALINISFLVAYLQLAELYPTSHRSSGTGFAAIVSSIAGTTAPYIAYSSTIWSRLSYVILFSLALVGFGATIFLPETLGQALPQNVLEAENHLTDEKFWSYRGKRPKCLKKQNSGTTEDEIMLNDRGPNKICNESPEHGNANSIIK